MTAIEAREPADGEGPFELDGVLDIAREATRSITQDGLGSASGRDDGESVDPTVVLADRLLALTTGNVAERELGRFVMRCLDIAEATRESVVSDDDEDTTDESGPGVYRVALSGVDAFESILSAAEAGKARAVTHAYVHAREELIDPTLPPGQRIKHTDGDTSCALSCEQITGADLAVVLKLPPGLAKWKVNEATRLVQWMPHTLARLEAGEITGYHQRLIAQEAQHYPPELAARLDELVCGRPFTGRYAGIGEHRVSTRSLRTRLDKAVEAIGFEPPVKKARKSGFAGRYVRFGLTGADGMTRLHGCLPSLHATAIDTLLNDLARIEHDTTTDDRTLEQRRADAFLTLFTGPAALSPAAQLALDVSAPTFDEDGQYVVVDEAQNTEAQSVWATIQLLAASLGLTFPDVPKATVNIDVTLETLTNKHSTGHARPAPASDTGQARSSAGEPGHACPSTDATEPAGEPEGSCPHPPDRPRDEHPPPADAAGRGHPPHTGTTGKDCPDANSADASHDADSRDSDSSIGSVDRHGAYDSHGATDSTGTGTAYGIYGVDAVCRDAGLLNEASAGGAAARHRAATLRGIGDIPASLAQRLLRFPDLRRIITDPLTGQPLEVGRREPSTKLRNAVLNRDRHCRFPACTRAAAPDLDHTTPYRDDVPAEGQTAPGNLETLCREHHRVKHQLHWHPDMQPDGSIIWRNNLLGITATT